MFKVCFYFNNLIIGVENDEYEVEEYVDKMGHIIDKKLEIYRMLNNKLQEFKKYLREEEEVHN